MIIFDEIIEFLSIFFWFTIGTKKKFHEKEKNVENFTTNRCESKKEKSTLDKINRIKSEKTIGIYILSMIDCQHSTFFDHLIFNIIDDL